MKKRSLILASMLLSATTIMTSVAYAPATVYAKEKNTEVVASEIEKSIDEDDDDDDDDKKESKSEKNKKNKKSNKKNKNEKDDAEDKKDVDEKDDDDDKKESESEENKENKKPDKTNKSEKDDDEDKKDVDEKDDDDDKKKSKSEGNKGNKKPNKSDNQDDKDDDDEKDPYTPDDEEDDEDDKDDDDVDDKEDDDEKDPYTPDDDDDEGDDDEINVDVTPIVGVVNKTPTVADESTTPAENTGTLNSATQENSVKELEDVDDLRVKSSTKTRKPKLKVTKADDSVKLKWDKSSVSTKKVAVYMKIGKGKFKRVAVVDASKGSYTKDLKAGKKYTFRIAGYTEEGDKEVTGTYSSSVKVKIKK